MSISDRRQARIIAYFLATSRLHLGLPERRRPSRSPQRYLRRAVLRLMLLAGSIGSLFGGVAFAEHDYRLARAEERGEQNIPQSPSLARVETPARASLERMP